MEKHRLCRLIIIEFSSSLSLLVCVCVRACTRACVYSHPLLQRQCCLQGPIWPSEGETVPVESKTLLSSETKTAAAAEKETKKKRRKTEKRWRRATTDGASFSCGHVQPSNWGVGGLSPAAFSTEVLAGRCRVSR